MPFEIFQNYSSLYFKSWIIVCQMNLQEMRQIYRDPYNHGCKNWYQSKGKPPQMTIFEEGDSCWYISANVSSQKHDFKKKEKDQRPNVTLYCRFFKRTCKKCNININNHILSNLILFHFFVDTILRFTEFWSAAVNNNKSTKVFNFWKELYSSNYKLSNAMYAKAKILVILFIIDGPLYSW